MKVYIVSEPYSDYNQIYGVRSTLEGAIKLAYDAYCDWYADEPDEYGYPMKFSTWEKNEHWVDWVVEFNVDGDSWINEGNWKKPIDK